MYNKTEIVTNENNIERLKPGRKRCKKKKRQGTLIQQSINFEMSRRTPAGIHYEQDFGDSFEEPKRDGFIRIAGGNINNFTPKNFNNEKGNLLRAFIRRYELDSFWGQEAGLNWDLMPHSGRLESMFQSENALYSVAAHNKHRTNGRQQFGGTFAMAFGELVTKATDSNVDPTGLGRWSWIQFSGKEGHTTRILSVYQPCHTSWKKTDSVYAQHLEYFRPRGCLQCPRRILIEDLKALILSWKGEGIKVLVFMDANKNMTNGHMERMLLSKDIGMRPVTLKNHPDLQLTPTYMRGLQAAWMGPSG
jgi:hypothetical protein